MQTFETSPDAEPEDGQQRAPLSATQILFRAVAGVVIVASFGVWVYAYSGMAKRDAPDRLADRQLATTADAICARTLAEVAALPNAIEAADGPERADQIRQATARFAVMLDELDALPTTDERDERIYRGWLSDYRVLLGDRMAYADRIEVDPNATFLISDIGVTERLDKRVTRFANTNLMVSCAAPTDV